MSSVGDWNRFEYCENKRPFDIDTVLGRVRTAVSGFRQAALFELANEGFNSPFEQLLACIISIRTRDEVTVEVARCLFETARTPGQIDVLTEEIIDKLITPSTFHEPKSHQIKVIARRIIDEFAGKLPCDEEVLLSFHGVGAKCANLVLGLACGVPKISVDVHVHRVTNRWGYVSATSPESTLRELESRLPQEYWVEINGLLVPFGKHICTGQLPKCSTCKVLDMCKQIGVSRHR